MQTVEPYKRPSVASAFISVDFLIAAVLMYVFWWSIPSYETSQASKQAQQLPDSPAVIAELNNMRPMQLAMNGNTVKAMDAANELLQRQKHDPLANLCAGTVFIMSGVKEDGLAHLKKAVALSHRNRYFSLFYAQKLAESDKPSDAIVQLQAVIKAYPKWLPPHLELANLYLMQRRPQEASDELATIYQIDPHNFQAKKVRGIALARMGQTKAGLDEYVEGLALESQSGPPDVLRAMMMDRAGRGVARVEFELQKQVNNRPEDYMPKLRLAQLYSYMNRAKEAKDLLLDARRLVPNNSEVQRTLAVVLKKLGEESPALSAFQISIKLDEGNEDKTQIQSSH